MHLNRTLKNKNGVTLIELLIALVISALLIAALYRTFIGQQKTYIVQEQVVDTQQNVRVAINKMMRDIRMAGFGGVDSVLNLAGGVNSYTQPITAAPTTITIVGGFKQIKDSNGNPITVSSIGPGANQITLSVSTGEFDGAAHGYISIGGLGSYIVQNQPVGTTNVLTLDRDPTNINPVGAFIFKVQAITYDINALMLRRNENTGGGAQPLAENIENLGFRYFDGGTPTTPPQETADLAKIRMIEVTVTARTNISDPDYKGGVGGYRRRQIASNIHVRNMGISP